jgi:carbamoyl-phosphate synthase small subunit
MNEVSRPPSPVWAGPVSAALVLADGSVFEGEAIGAPAPGGVSCGEVVFNTVLSGYQEVISDPSYAGQIINFTSPHIGNYGVNPTDDEARRPFCRGVVVRELARRRSNWRSTEDLDAYLRRHGVPGIAGVDTRRLTRRIRDIGAIPAAFGTADVATLHAAALAEPGTAGVDLVRQVSVEAPYTVGNGPWRVVAYDFGIKTNIVRHLSKLATVTVVPGWTTADEVRALSPHGVFLSNGPGDPKVCDYAVKEIAALAGVVPIFGICLGHQLLAAAMGAQLEKLPFGHHGGNHPVRHVETGRVEITSQNHNFAVVAGSHPGASVTHVNLNDGVVEGLRYRDIPAFSVQHHPEAGPGPHESTYLFDEFDALMAANNSTDKSANNSANSSANKSSSESKSASVLGGGR